MFQFTFGDIGSGKSLSQADLVLGLLARSVKIQKKYKKPIREIWCNFHLSKSIQEKYDDRLRYWQTPQEMIFTDYPKKHMIRRDFDVVWDEMAVELPSDKWKDTDPAIRRFFAQHRKRGIQIFGNTQDYMMLDINARRMATSVFETQKLCGNRDPSSTLPDIKHIWGLVWVWELNKSLIRDTGKEKQRMSLLPFKWLWITRRLTTAYDTGEDISKAERIKLLHLEYFCDTCGKIKKVEHIPI